MCQLQLPPQQVPLHAFLSSEDDTVDEDIVYYTVNEHNDLEDIENGPDALDLAVSFTDEDSFNEPSDVEDLSSPDIPVLDRNDPFRRTQRLNDIIQSTSEFLSSHPRPPADFMRRQRKLPARYQDYDMGQDWEERRREEEKKK